MPYATPMHQFLLQVDKILKQYHIDLAMQMCPPPWIFTLILLKPPMPKQAIRWAFSFLPNWITYTNRKLLFLTDAKWTPKHYFSASVKYSLTKKKSPKALSCDSYVSAS